MKKLFFALLICVFAAPVYAASEVVQIVAFSWDFDTEKLVFESIGSGTAIDGNLILTNKHVVSDSQGDTGDFFLLCPVRGQSKKPVRCDIPAAVTATHPEFDAALMRPLSSEVYLHHGAISQKLLRQWDRVRLHGFPIPLENVTNFGSEKTIANVRQWLAEGGSLEVQGDSVTTTRGRVLQLLELTTNGAIYYLTDSKVHFGNSGGAAFDENHRLIGIPTLRDENYHALVLAYPQLHDWVEENRDEPAEVRSDVLDFYNTLQRKAKARFHRAAPTRLRPSSRVTQRRTIRSRRRTYRRSPGTRYRSRSTTTSTRRRTSPQYYRFRR